MGTGVALAMESGVEPFAKPRCSDGAVVSDAARSTGAPSAARAPLGTLTYQCGTWLHLFDRELVVQVALALRSGQATRSGA